MKNHSLQPITTSAPGKIFIMGEHAVVYGKPGLLCSIDSRCQVKLTPHTRKTITITSDQYDTKLSASLDQMVEFTQQARHRWQEFDTSQDVALLQQITTGPLDLVQLSIVESFAQYRTQPTNLFDIHINSQIPPGSGLGSSAAVAVSVIAAVTKTLPSIAFDIPTIHQIAHTVEKYQHGNSSGADPATVAFGGLRWYRKESPVFQVISGVGLDIPKQINDQLLLVMTGKPAESTGELVSYVRAVSDKKRDHFTQTQEQICRDILLCLSKQDSKAFAQLIKSGQKQLAKLGVVSDSAKAFIRQVEGSGGVAKISGAGGQKTGSGVVMVFHPDKKQIHALAQKHRFTVFATNLGGIGVSID